MNFKKLASLLFLLLFFVSCNDYEKIMGPALKTKMSDKNPNPVFDGEIEPPMPNPWENDKTLLGIDTNNNGIRDDIDIWINRTGKTYNERMALRQLAKAFREEWVAANMAYENFKKGPLDIHNKKAIEYDNSIADLIQVATSKEADATMGCMSFIFVQPKYKHEEKMLMEDSLEELYLNSKVRREVRETYYKYSHIFGVTENKKNNHEYCIFKVENLEQANVDLERSYEIQRKESGYKYDKK